jgi:hypothetical protein
VILALDPGKQMDFETIQVADGMCVHEFVAGLRAADVSHSRTE